MEKEIIKSICSNCNWHERIIVKLFNKVFIKSYHMGRINCWNSKK